MSTVFALLFLLSIFFLLWGVIHPASLSKQSKKPLTRKDAAIGFGIIAFVFMILTSVTAPQQASKQPVAASQPARSSIQHQSALATPKPVVTTETATETKPVPFTKTTVMDASRSKGSSAITTVGVDGIETMTYQITKTDGLQTDKKLVSDNVTLQPINEVTSVGTKTVVKTPAASPKPAATPAPVAQSAKCDPNYSGACVPIDSDVDCGGGSGNGPSYVYSRVKVIGSDIYGLDSNHDGYGCDSL